MEYKEEIVVAGIVTDFFDTLRDATPKDCRKVFDALTDFLEREMIITPAAQVALSVQEILLVFGMMLNKAYLEKGAE